MLPVEAVRIGRSIVSVFDSVIEALCLLEDTPKDDVLPEKARFYSNALSEIVSNSQIETLFPGLRAMIARHAAPMAGLTDVSVPSDVRKVRLLFEDSASVLLDLLDRSDSARPWRRYHLLNHLIERFGYTRYLEIGCASDECFLTVQASCKIGVDPVAGGTHRMTSDQFFAQNGDTFDLVFVDGLHEYQQVERDIANALACLSPNGTVVLHDCAPVYEIRQIVPPQTGVWSGDVWKAIVTARRNPSIDTIVGDFDYGCGVIRPRRNTAPLLIDTSTPPHWREVRSTLKEVLRLMEWESVLVWI